ncbi:virion-encapsulated RNA polymerase [Ruegeria phage vB_RpoP-V13]|uniref:Virion-encapsulated RNA polymerase n=1 Tax=Ruegeria phage vB_RpoP-V13 TaxID=2218612 RepID=A0A2Z4QHU9_9CAUD|nr:virion RNA polymerase [Ruegeria phage vB_RpoP-V13]AWY09411.1 virion-encapsulated RNA polymerase [Ruegeria phage vB_RpoP-V13]
MVDTARPSLSAEDEIANALRDSTFQDVTAVAQDRGNDRADQELQQDLANMTQLQLRAKYGDRVALNRNRLIDGRNRLTESDEASRTIGEAISDTAFAFGNSVYRGIGTLSNLAYGYAEGALDGDPNTTGAGQAAKYLDAHNQVVAIMQQVTLSDQLKERQRFEGIASELDKEDSANQATREIQEGADPFWAGLRQQGRDAINALERNASDPMLAGNIIADGVGSLASSAPLAGAGGLIAKGASQALVKNALTQRVALAVGTSAGAGVSEVSSVYAQAASDVMGLDTNQLLQSSSVMQGLVAEGLSPEEAKVQLAGMTAETAAVRQMAPALALGFITSRFERMPLGAFADSGIAKGMLQIAGEGLEEAGQEFSGAVNQNIAVEQFAQIGRAALEGAGEQAALGMLGGLGMAGVSATPAAAVGTVRAGVNTGRAAADALFNDVTYNDPLRQEIFGREAPAARAAAVASDLAVKAKEQAVSVASTVSQSEVVAKAVDTVKTKDAKIAQKVSQEALDVSQTVSDDMASGSYSDEVVASVAPETTSGSYAGLEGGNVFETVAAISAKAAEKGFRPTAEDTQYANAQIQRLRQVAGSLSPRAKRQVAGLLSSKFVEKVEAEATKLDLNKETPTGEVTPQEVETTVNVASSNPANVNPERVNKILEESGENITPLKNKILKVASAVSGSVNRNAEAQVEISRGEQIALTQNGEKAGKAKSIKDTTRSILADGWTDRNGKDLRSVNDFAADLIKGIQSPDGTVVDKQGRPSKVQAVAEQFNNFAQHMVNRVNALNESFDSNYISQKTGKLVGRGVKFRGLANGTKWYDANDPQNYFSPLAYHRGDPNSVALAQQVEADTIATVEALNAFKQEFPELFQGMPDVVVPVLKREGDQTPTAIDEDTPQAVSEEQNQQTQEEFISPAAVEEETAVSDEQQQDTAVEAASQTIDEEGNSEGGADETGANATDETVTTEEIASEEQITDDSTEEEIRGWMNNPEAWSEADRTRVNEKSNDLVKASKDLITEYFGENVAKRLHRVIVYPANKALGPGYAHVSDDGKTREIYISDALMKDGKLTKLGKAVVLHEMAHVVDFSNHPTFISAQTTFQPGGAIYQEALFLEAHSPWVKDRMDYANSYKGDDPVSHRAELFAVMSEFYFSKDGSILENSPAILALMEEVYGPRTRSETTGVTTDDEQTSTNESPAEGAGSGAVEEGRTRKVNPEFSKVFKEKNTEGHPKNLGEFLTKMQESGAMNTETLEFVKTLAPLLRNLLNARLQEKTTDNKVKKSILDHIKDGRTIFRRFKAGLLVDPETGRYDDDMVDLAAVAVADWLITNKGSDPRKLDDTLEKLGLSIHDINDEDHMSVMLGVPPANAADGLASDILRMWDVTADNEAQTDAIHGIAQGFAKEIFTVLSNDPNTNYLTVEPLTIKRDDRKVKTETILVNSDEMKAVRQKVLAANESGMKLTAKEVMFNETRPIYSIGTKIPSVASRQNRSSVQLSGLERRALQKMQDTPNYLDEGMATIIANLGEGVLQEILGYRFDVEEIQNPVLRRSVRGKNASILADIDEIIALGGNDSLTADTPVYFPVGITKVGRHQYQGPNPQSNKLMRSLITPTWSTVSVSNLNNFWLAVGQASDIKGINKAEKLSHADIVKNAPEAFYAKYGDAVKQIKSLIQSGTMDQDALKQALGVVEPQQLKAVLAVAQLEIAVENGDSTFRTSLSFELDGLTNGVANMMINFGQGELTDEDYWNFQRVGFFPGKKNQTVNKYFAQVGALDMYETVARLGDQMLKLAQGSNSQRDWQKEQKKAAIRLAAVIGNFDPETGNMSRNTAKNPMTKVNYGSGVKGVAVGVADDMLLEFYKQLEVKPENVKMDDYFYPGFTKDMNALGINVNDTSNKSFVAYPDQVEKFRTAIQYSIGNVLTEATKETIGSKINDLNDLMVLSTNLQSKYLQAMYEKKVAKLGEDLADDRIIERTKDGAPKLAQIPQKYFRALEKELMQMSPIFVSDEQTLAIGGFEKRLSNLLTSSNYDEKLAQKALMPQPDDVGVKSIPFTVIGTGDAMMMNLIFGNENAPNDVLGIFDGLDIPLEKIQEYAPFVNEQVAKSWDRDVLSMAIANFDGFLSHPDLDQTVLAETLDGLMQENKKESLNGMDSPEKIQKSLQERLRENQARKAVFKQLAISVDQMGGSDIGFTREGEEVSLIEINHRIRRLLEQKPQKVENDVKEPVFETTVKDLYTAMKLNQKQLDVLELVQARSQDTRVIMGTVEQLRAWMEQNTPDSANVLLDVKGAYDPVNNIMYLTSKNPETFIHEVIHTTTFNKVLDHYEGNTNKWVQNIENLMNEFLAIESQGQNVMNAQAAILRHVNQTDPFRKAAALNEFMAWSLSNQHVRDKLKSTETNTLKSLAAKVVKLMQRMFGGIVPTDMYSALTFNTALLMNPSLEEKFADGTGGNGDGGDNGGNGNGGDGGERTPLGNNMTNYWIETLEKWIDTQDISTETGNRRLRNLALDQANADRVMDTLRQAGLLRNALDRQTFRAIYGILKSEMILDPNSLIALTKVFQHVEANMTPEMFGSGSEAANTYSAVLNSFGSFQRGETSDAVAVLFALSQTSEKFRAVLDQIPEPETGEPGVGLNAFMARGTAIFMNKLMGTIQDGAPKEVMDGLKKTIIDANREKEYAVLRKVTSSLDAADAYFSGQLSRAAEGMRTIDAQTKASTASKARKYIVSALTLGTNLLDRPGSELTAQAAQKSVHMGLPILSLVPIRELVDEFVGTNRLNKDFVAMLDVVNTKISGLRQSFREDLPGILNAEFQTQPVKEQWESMHKTLGATDFTRLVNIQNMQRSMQILEESGVRQSRIQAAETQLQGMLSGSDFSDALDKAKQLADFMNKKGAGKLLVRNAYAIAKNLDGGFVEVAVPVLDELISLYAVDTMDADVRETTVQLWQNEPQAMTAMISYLQSLNEAEDQKAVSEMAKLNGYKGYVPNIGKDNHRVVVALDSAEEEMIHRGFKKMAPFTGDVDSLYPRSYYVTNISHQGMYSQGIMQNVAMTYRGVDVNTGMSVTGDTAGFIYGQDVIERVVETMLDDSFELENNGETLMPVFDEDGAIMGFERSIAPEVAEAFLGRQDNLAVNMGAWAGRQIEEELAYQYNIALVDKLDDLWQNREPGTDKEFVNLKKTNDKIYKESFNLIPVAVKRYMDGKFDGNGMMVPESMVNLSVGYREASVADLWTGKTRMPKELVKGVQAVTRMQLGQTSLRTLLVKGEKAGQSLVSDAKDIIVVKSLVVPLANTQANVIQLANNGVPVKQIVKNYRLKLAEITEFNKNSVKLMQLESKKRLTTDPRQRRLLDDKIKVINDLNARMTIAPMIAAGAYKQLSEGLTDIDVAATSGGLAEWMEKQTAKLPDTMAAIAQNAMVSKSTKLYQAANRATQYGDFLAKSIYYDHLLEQGLSKEEAIVRMNEEFVNFSFPAGRFRSMLERNGVLWFPSFKLRIAKIAAKQMRENPVRSMALNVPFDFGGPIEDNIFSVIGDGRIDYATGWEMLFAAPELNPWVNLMNG